MLMLCKVLITGLAVCQPAPQHVKHYAPRPVAYATEQAVIQHPFPGNGTVCGGGVLRASNRDLCDFQASGAGRY